MALVSPPQQISETASSRVSWQADIATMAGLWAVFSLACLASRCLTPPVAMLGLAVSAVGVAAVRIAGGGRWTLYAIAFLVAVTLFRLWYLSIVPVDLSGDEAQYWDWSRRMDWCYYSKGPGVAACIWLSRLLLGDTAMAVRAPAAILTFASSLLMLALGRRLYNRQVGLLSAVLYQLTPIYAVYGLGMTTDPPFIFAWLAAMLLFHWAWSRGSAAGFVLAGAMVGIGILAKYTMAIFFLGAFLMLLCTPQGRKQLRRPWPYLGFVVCVLIILPIFYWNSQHDWLNFRHNAGHTSYDEGVAGIGIRHFAMFVGSQLGVVTPVLAVMVVISAIRVRKSQPLCFYFSVPILAFFVLKSIQGEVLTNWALVCYLSALIAFSWDCLANFNKHNVHVRRLTKAAVVIAVLAMIGTNIGFVAKFPERMDPMKKLRMGVPQLARELDPIWQGLDGPKFIAADDYKPASLLAFYMDGRPQTYCINIPGRDPLDPRRHLLGRAHMCQFDVWPGFYGLVGYNAVIVAKDDVGMSPELGGKFQSYERKVFKVRSYSGSTRTYTVFICRGFKGMEPNAPKRF